MCAKGGGDNRCLPHNPVSKFVVKVVTVRTKADETLVNKTLGELSKEGKNLPSPEPEVVKSWVETEKFAAQYDPALSEHDRKIQINRLNRAETENVDGGHFHAWKNLHGAVRSKVTQKIAAAGLLVGMSVSLVGCFANGNVNNNTPVVPSNAPTSISQVMGSGEKVETETGTYEKIVLNPDAPAYQFSAIHADTPEMKEIGWSVKDGAAGQRSAVDYMTKEFIDSTALEGGDAAYQEWYANSAPKYYSESILPEIATNPGENKIILGNFGQNKFMPNLIHDGKPREKTLDLKVTGFKAVPEYNGVEYSIEYNAAYRVDDANAAKFVGLHTGLSSEAVLQSKYAKDVLKDGTGENLYRAKGFANIVVTKDASGQMKMVGFSSQADFDTTDFANPNG